MTNAEFADPSDERARLVFDAVQLIQSDLFAELSVKHGSDRLNQAIFFRQFVD